MDTLCTSGCNLEDILKKNKQGVTIDNGLLAVTSENSIKKLLKKYWFCQEYQTNVMNLKKNCFIPAKKHQFNYCFFLLMFCSRTSNNKINKVHARALRVILAEDLNDFESLLQKKKDICSHHKNIQKVMN